VFAAGTGESINARIHAANSQGNRAEEGRRSACRHNTNSLGEMIEFFVTWVAGIVVAGARISNGCVSRSGGVTGSAKGSKKFKKIQEHNDRWAPRHGVCLLIHSTRLSSSPSTRRFSGNPSLFARIPMIIPIILGNQSKTELLNQEKEVIAVCMSGNEQLGNNSRETRGANLKNTPFPLI